MVRIALALIVCIGLAACQRDDPPRATVSTQNVGDSRVAKELFGRVPVATSQASQAVGGYARGCQGGAVQLAETGPTWQAMRLSRNRNWAQPDTVDFIQDLSRFAARQSGWEGLYVPPLIRVWRGFSSFRVPRWRCVTLPPVIAVG